MPILGIMASQISGHLAAGPSFDSIATTTVSTATATVTFSSIPATYTHLQIRFLSQSNRTSSDSGDYLSIRFNSDSGSNYYYGHQVNMNNNTASAFANGSGTSILIERIQNYETDANSFTAGVTDILDYANTNKYKTMRSLLGYSTNSVYRQLNFASALWMSNTAISSIAISMANAQHTQYSSFALYGIKGA
jgi:hypothetical protein